MTGLELLALAYVCVGLGCAALVFHVVTGGWDHLPERDAGQPGVEEAGQALDLMRFMRSDHPVPFGIVVGLVILVAVLAWPIPAVVFVWGWARRLWARRPCRCEDCRAARRAKR